MVSPRQELEDLHNSDYYKLYKILTELGIGFAVEPLGKNGKKMTIYTNMTTELITRDFQGAVFEFGGNNKIIHKLIKKKK